MDITHAYNYVKNTKLALPLYLLIKIKITCRSYNNYSNIIKNENGSFLFEICTLLHYQAKFMTLSGRAVYYLIR